MLPLPGAAGGGAAWDGSAAVGLAVWALTMMLVEMDPAPAAALAAAAGEAEAEALGPSTLPAGVPGLLGRGMLSTPAVGVAGAGAAPRRLPGVPGRLAAALHCRCGVPGWLALLATLSLLRRPSNWLLPSLLSLVAEAAATPVGDPGRLLRLPCLL